MIRLPRWIFPALAILFLVAIAAPGNSSQHASAAPQAATQQPTRRPAASPTPLLPTYTPGPQAATPDANANQGPLVFGTAPSPDAGTLGVVLDSSQGNVAIQSVVTGGPAEKAGIQGGDVVTAVDGKAVANSGTLISAITAKKTGDTLTLTVDRGGKSQDIPVTIASRREVYCPLPAPTVTTGASLITGNPRWALDQSATQGVKLTLSGSKMSLKPPDPGQQWSGIASIKLNSPTPADYQFSVDITQTNQTLAGILLNYDSVNSTAYLLGLQFNGSWYIRAIHSDGTANSGPSFSESSWKTPDASNPAASATNTVVVTFQNNNWYLSLNGTFVCGVPLSQFVDPLLKPAQVGALVTVDSDPSGKLGVSFSKVGLHALAKSASATEAATQAGS